MVDLALNNTHSLTKLNMLRFYYCHWVDTSADWL